MANKVISIEIGYSLTKVCETDYRSQKPKVYNSFTLETPEGILEDGVLNGAQDFAITLKTALKEHKMKVKQVLFSITSTKIATREVLIPFVKENRIADVVRANATEYFPIDLSQYQFTHSILGVETDMKGTQQYKLQVLAAPNTLLLGYKQFADEAGLDLVGLDYNGNSLYNAVREEFQTGTQVILKIDERSTMIMVLKNSVVLLNRSVAYGVDDALQIILETQSFGRVNTYQEALALVAKRNCLYEYLHADEITFEESEEMDKAKQVMTESFAYMIGGVGRVLDYYNSRNTSAPIDLIKITGLGAEVVGLTDLLRNELGTQTEVLDNLQNVQFDKNFDMANLGKYVGIIGAAIEPLDFIGNLFESKSKKYAKLAGKNGKEEASGKGTKGKGQKDYDLICKVIMIGGLLIAAVLILTSALPYFAANKENKSLNAKIVQLEPAFPIYEAYENAKNSYSKMVTWDLQTVSRLEELNVFLTSMEQNMPASFAVQGFNATADGVTMDVTVDNKDAAAKVLNELQAIEMVQSADVLALFEEESEIGEIRVSFSVVITFKPIATSLSEKLTEFVVE